MIHLYTGTYRERPFVGVHTMVESERLEAATAVDSLSNIYGPTIPDLTPTGWLIRQMAPGILPPSVPDRFRDNNHFVVQQVGSITVEHLQPFVGPEQIKRAFEPVQETQQVELTGEAA